MSGPQWPANYEIRVNEILGVGLSARFEGLEVRGEADETVISGSLPDESALQGVLAKVRDLGLHLIVVRRLGAQPGGEKRTGPVILRGERVLLRPVDAEDVERLAQIGSESEVARWWGAFGVEDIRREFIDASSGFVIEVDGDVVGAIQYAEESEPMYRHASIDIFLTSPRHGQGIGSEAIRVLARYLFDKHGHHRLTIDPAVSNHAAIRAYERVGFRKVGVMRRYERGPDGTWRDGLLMDMLREGFRDKGDLARRGLDESGRRGRTSGSD